MICTCHEEIHVHARKYIGHVTTYTCTYTIIMHVYVQYTALDSTSCGHTGTCSNKYGVLRRKVASAPGSTPHERTLILTFAPVEM